MVNRYNTISDLMLTAMVLLVECKVRQKIGIHIDHLLIR
jgi:hypothetical protein